MKVPSALISIAAALCAWSAQVAAEVPAGSRDFFLDDVRIEAVDER